MYKYFLLLTVFLLSLQTLHSDTSGQNSVGENAESLKASIQSLRPGEESLDTYRHLCERVYRTRDIDLISLCWENPDLNVSLVRLMNEETDVTFRGRLVQMMLRASPKSWYGSDESVDVLGAAGALGTRVAYCRDVLRHYLSSEIIQHYSLLRRSDRLQVASLLENAMSSSVPVSPSLPARSIGNPMKRHFFDARWTVAIAALLIGAAFVLTCRSKRIFGKSRRQ